MHNTLTRVIQIEECDAVLEMSGHADSVVDGVQALRVGGTYVLVGLVHPDSALALTGEQIIRKCLTLRGVHNYSPHHLEEGIAFLERTADRFPYADLVSPPVPLSRFEEALELSAKRRWLRVAVSPHLES